MNAETFNARYPIGTPVFAYPGTRPPHGDAERLVTRTRSRASVLGGHTDVVWVEGHDACIALTHVDVVSTDVFKAAAVVEGALPMPVGGRSTTEQDPPVATTVGLDAEELAAERRAELHDLCRYETNEGGADPAVASAYMRRMRTFFAKRDAESSGEQGGAS